MSVRIIGLEVVISSVLTSTKFIGIIELGSARDDLQVSLACGDEGQEEHVGAGEDGHLGDTDHPGNQWPSRERLIPNLVTNDCKDNNY